MGLDLACSYSFFIIFLPLAVAVSISSEYIYLLPTLLCLKYLDRLRFWFDLNLICGCP